MGSIESSDAFNVLLSLWNKEKHPLNSDKADIPTNEDISICARIRPLLEKELDSGQAVGSVARHGVAIDVHQLAPSFPGTSGPRLKVNNKLYEPISY
jgi:hypothetical protein